MSRSDASALAVDEDDALIACGRRPDELCYEVTGRAEVTIERRRRGDHAAADAMAAETRRVLAEHVAALDDEEDR